MALEIEYGRPEWRHDAEAADAEASRRVALAAAAEDLADRETVFLSDLRALTRIPAGLGEIRGLRRLIVGDEKGPDGEFYQPSQEIGDFAGLAEAPDLIELNLIDTGLADLAPLAGLTALQSLSLDNTRVADLAPLAGLTALQSLSLYDTQVADLAPLAGLTALQSLSLGSTQVADLAPLVGLTALRSLSLDFTKVADLSPLGSIQAIRNLELYDSEVADLRVLLSLPAFAEENSAALDVRETPATRADPGLAAAAGTEDLAEQAVRVVRYLKDRRASEGEPDGRDSEIRDQLRAYVEGAPLALVVREGRLEIADADAVPLSGAAESDARGLADAVRLLASQLHRILEGRQGAERLCLWTEIYRDAVPVDGLPNMLNLDDVLESLIAEARSEFTAPLLQDGDLRAVANLAARHAGLRRIALGAETRPFEAKVEPPEAIGETVPPTRAASAAAAFADGLSRVPGAGLSIRLFTFTQVKIVGVAAEAERHAASPAAKAASASAGRRALGRLLAVGGVIAAGAAGVAGFGANATSVTSWMATPQGARLTKAVKEFFEGLGLPMPF